VVLWTVNGQVKETCTSRHDIYSDFPHKFVLHKYFWPCVNIVPLINMPAPSEVHFIHFIIVFMTLNMILMGCVEIPCCC